MKNKKNVYIGVVFGEKWMMSPKFMNQMNYDDGDPDIAIPKATNAVFKMIQSINENHKQEDWKIDGLLQFGQAVRFLFHDDYTNNIIKNISKQEFEENICIYPFIHHPNDTHPEKPEFLESIEKNFELTKIFGSNAILVHFHTKEQNPSIFEETLNALINPDFLELIEKYKIEVVYENNQHGSYMGYPKNIMRLFKELDKKLDDLGKNHLIKYFNFCLDYGHMLINFEKKNINPEEGFKEFIESFGDRITAFHIHTNDGVDDLHLAPLDINRLILSDKKKKSFSSKHLEKIAQNSNIIWKSLEYWAKKTKNSRINRYFIFEIGYSYNQEILNELAVKLAKKVLM